MVAIGALLAFGCGSAPPRRHVIEQDIGVHAYRRYQKVLDVEVPVSGNPAVGHTATYVERHGEDLALSTAFVTVYERARGLTAEVAARLDQLGTYDVEVVEVHGQHVWRLRGGDETWLLWVSGKRVVKLGAPPEEDVPDDISEAYLDLYPSDLDEHGRARERTASAGRARGGSQPGDEEDTEPEMPRHLQEGHVQ